MFYIDIPPPVYYQYQPEIVIEQYEPYPIYIQPQPVYIPAYPTVEMRQTILSSSGTIILDRSRDRFYLENY